MKSLAVVFRKQALNDLEQISGYISKDNPQAANRAIQRIHHVIFKTIAWFPRSGRLDPDTGAREFPVPGLPYIVIYVPKDDLIDVVGIFHAARDPATKPRP
jgi:plasmid stabilization system protein ParE